MFSEFRKRDKEAAWKRIAIGIHACGARSEIRRSQSFNSPYTDRRRFLSGSNIELLNIEP
jgi:hypothetical protein